MDTLEEIQQFFKSVVPESTVPSDYRILLTEDDMMKRIFQYHSDSIYCNSDPQKYLELLRDIMRQFFIKSNDTYYVRDSDIPQIKKIIDKYLKSIYKKDVYEEYGNFQYGYDQLVHSFEYFTLESFNKKV